jgi:hypothetical protein
MNDSTRDYYDIPAEWIPSPNFAGRPASEISEINLMDGLWTFMSSSGSSSSSSEHDDIPTPIPRDVAESTEAEHVIPQRLEITVTGPDFVTPQPRRTSLSKDVNVHDRPILLEKASSSPSGGFTTPNYAPQPPIRAISARLGTSRSNRGTLPQREDSAIDPFSFEGAQDDKRVGPQGRLPSPPKHMDSGHGSSVIGDTKLPGSFSQKERVRRTLDERNVARLRTDIVDFESRGLLSSPISMLSTPRELYPISEKCPAVDEPLSPSSPQAKDARRSIMSSLSGNGSSLYLLKLHRQTSMHDDRIVKMYPPGWQPIYLPGPISLEKHPAQLRKDSVASLDPFAKELEPRVRRHSDMIVLDSITGYFDDFGVMEDPTEACFDMFWRHTHQAPDEVADARKCSITSVEEPPLRSPESQRSRRSLQGSRFSFSSVSSSSSLPRTGTPMRQRDRLKKLLSPAFPSSAFLRTPVFKEQDSKSDVSSVGEISSTATTTSARGPDKQRLDRILHELR